MPGDTTPLEVTLAVQPVPLPGVTVRAPTTAERHGFLDRLNRGGCLFYTREQIAQKNLVLSADLVREIPGMQLAKSGASVVITNQSLRQNITGRTCPIATFLDGVPTPADLVVNIAAEFLEGVEVYNIPENVPSEYSGPHTSCGAMLVWTNWRDRR